MNRQARFAAAKDFAVYYGRGLEEKLGQFDLAIVEPAGQNTASLDTMRLSGTLVLAYLSVMELPPWARETSLLTAGDFLQQEGRPLMNREYGNYLVDLRSRRWLGLLLHRAWQLLAVDGFDGLFLDTIGNVESPALPADLGHELAQAAASFVQLLRTTFPHHILVQNCGLEKLCFLTAGHINGLCWENPPLSDKSSRAAVHAVANQLEWLGMERGIKILLLIEEERPNSGGLGDAAGKVLAQARRIAACKQFLLYSAPYRYTAGVNGGSPQKL